MKVTFRKDKAGKFKDDITAVFPGVAADTTGGILCYAHIGQHGACDMQWIVNDTVPAKPHEYASLLKELRSIYKEKLEVSHA